LNAYQGISARR